MLKGQTVDGRLPSHPARTKLSQGVLFYWPGVCWCSVFRRAGGQPLVYRLQASGSVADVIAGQVDVFSAQRRQVLKNIVVHRLSGFSEPLSCPL